MTEGLSPSRRTLVLLVAPIVVLSVMGTVASAFAPALAAHHPLLLIAFDSRNRMLVLARHVGLAQFILVACTRRMLKVPLSYALGRLYGDSAIRWLEKKGGGGALVRLSEKVFSRAAYPVVFLSPSLIVCALAGVTEMSPVGFLLTALAGTVASVLAVRAFSGVVAGPVDAVLGFFSHHLLATTLISIGLVVLSLVASRAQGALGPSLDELDERSPGTQEPSKSPAPDSEC